MPGASKRRHRILCAAERLLKHYGFHKTTVADIAREAGVGVGSVYLEFSSKEEIVGALSEKRHGAVLEAMRQAATAGESYAERLERVLEARVHRLIRVAREGQHGLDLVRCVCPAVSEVQQQFREQERELLSGLLAEASRAGEFAVTEPGGTAGALLRVCDTFAPASGTRQDLKRLQHELALVCRLILEGLRAR